MAMSPTEFSPEITDEYLKKLQRGYQERGQYNIGLARSEARARGLEDTPTESGPVSGIRSAVSTQLGESEANLRYGLAGLAREERLLGEGRTYESGEREKERTSTQGFAERMARLRQGWEEDQANTANRRGYQQALWQLPGQLGGMALGGWAGSGARGFGRTA